MNVNSLTIKTHQNSYHEMHKKHLAAGLCPDPLGELKRSPRPHSLNEGKQLRKEKEAVWDNNENLKLQLIDK